MLEKAKVLSTIIKDSFIEIKTVASGMAVNAKLISVFGFMSRPYEGMSCVRSETISDDVVLGVIQKAIDDLGEGESIQFARTKEGLKATIVTRTSGQIEFNGTGDFLVKYNELKSEYDKTKAVVDAILSTLSVEIPEPGEGSPSAFQKAIKTAVGTKTTGDISGAKAGTLETK